jgi:hypothetical protein
MKLSASIASHMTPKEPGPAVDTGPGASFEQDPWHIGKMDGSIARKEREADYVICETESKLAMQAIDAAEAERKADLEEQIRKRSLNYEDLPGTPKRFGAIFKVRDVARLRYIDCVHYNDCLGYAAFKNWPSFICTGCKYAQVC